MAELKLLASEVPPEGMPGKTAERMKSTWLQHLDVLQTWRAKDGRPVSKSVSDFMKLPPSVRAPLMATEEDMSAHKGVVDQLIGEIQELIRRYDAILAKAA